jgi:hypothetical protein
MEPPPVNKKAINRRSSIESSQSKKKSSRACAPCRKRKVHKKIYKFNIVHT